MENENRTIEDVDSPAQINLSSLEDNFSLSNLHVSLLKKFRTSKLLIGIILMSLIVCVASIAVLWSQYKHLTYQNKLHYQMLYNINKSAFNDSRKEVATLWFSSVALLYYPYYTEQDMSDLAELVYETGEVKYNIPMEFWATFFAYESSFNFEVVHQRTGATGLSQIMPVLGSYLAEACGIPYKGSKTLKNPLYNARMGMRFYKDLFDEYGFKFALCGYNWGEGKANEWKKAGSIPKTKRFYYHNFLRTKVEIEQATGKKYPIPYIDSKDYAYIESKYLKEKVEKLKQKVKTATSKGDTN